MGIQRVAVALLTGSLLFGCASIPVVAPSQMLPLTRSAAQRLPSWAIGQVATAPTTVMATFEAEKTAVIKEMQTAENLRSVTVSPDVAVQEWRMGGKAVGYVLTVHGNVVFDLPKLHKTGAFIVDFCIDATGTDFGGVYAFTVKSEHPVGTLRPARPTRGRTSALSLERVAQKPEAIRVAAEALKGQQQATVGAQFPGLRLTALKSFPTAIAVRHEGALVGYIDAQTSSGLPKGDVLGIQVRNYFTPGAKPLFGDARAASANDPKGYRHLSL
jgi:hypothetical protein